MNIPLAEIDADAVKETMVRETRRRDVVALQRNIEANGQLTPIQIVELTAEERESAKQRRIQAVASKTFRNEESRKKAIGNVVEPKYGIRDGRHRFAAINAFQKGKGTIRTEVVDRKSESEEIIAAINANMQVGMSPVDRGKAIAALQEQYSLSVEEISRKMGISKQMGYRCLNQYKKTQGEEKTRKPNKNGFAESKFKKLLEQFQKKPETPQDKVSKLDTIRELQFQLTEARKMLLSERDVNELYRKQLAEKRSAALGKKAEK